MTSNNQTNTISKKLKIVQINVNSLIQINRRYDLHQFIGKHNPDIVLLSETKLNSKHRVQFVNFNIVRKDRKNSSQAGGTAILIRKDLKYSSYTNNITNSFKTLETCIIRIPLATNKLLYIISAYYPSGNNNAHFKSELFKLFESMDLENENNYYILGGDLNCKHTDWKNPTNNQKGCLLKEWLTEN